MKFKSLYYFPIYLILSSCFGPRNVDYKTVWFEQGKELKLLVKTLKTKNNLKYGNHDFPSSYDYPFDDGFHVSFGFDHTGETIHVDDKNLTIKFYTDRGLMDHFSAFIYTNDQKEIAKLDVETEQDKNDEDVKLQEHWYYIQD